VIETAKLERAKGIFWQFRQQLFMFSGNHASAFLVRSTFMRAFAASVIGLA
jgi:hypothetical protein